MSESQNNSAPNLEKSLQHLFVRWLIAAVAALALATVFNAWTSNDVLAADVFIDEGEGDFEIPTPVETPADRAVSSDGESETSSGSDAGVGLDFDSDFDAAKAGGTAEAGAPPVIDTTVAPESVSGVESTMPDSPEVAAPVTPVAPAVKKPAKTAAKKSSAKKAAKVEKKSGKKKAEKSAKAKGKSVAKASKSSKKKPADGNKKKTRKTASIKFAGGQYVTTSRDCAMESAPGAGDSVGQTKSKRKLWVEDAGDAGYWKVYSKSGQAAFLSRSCF